MACYESLANTTANYSKNIFLFKSISVISFIIMLGNEINGNMVQYFTWWAPGSSCILLLKTVKHWTFYLLLGLNNLHLITASQHMPYLKVTDVRLSLFPRCRNIAYLAQIVTQSSTKPLTPQCPPSPILSLSLASRQTTYQERTVWMCSDWC